MSAGQFPSGIVLAAINAKWIHPSLALRLLKANLGPLEKRCEIIEFALRQPLGEKIDPVLAARPRILGISVSIWNHIATVELLRELEKVWGTRAEDRGEEAPVPRRPVIVLGGPEVSHLPPGAEIFRYADYVIHGEAELAFRSLCEYLLGPWQNMRRPAQNSRPPHLPAGSRFLYAKADFSEMPVHLRAKPVNPSKIKSAYYLFSDEDLRGKLIYVEASRGCPFNCEFCLSAVKPVSENAGFEVVREFPLEQFLDEMGALIRRGTRTFKFLDRTFNLNLSRAKQIMEFFLDKIDEINNADVSKKENSSGIYTPFTVHFEMVPLLFPPELRETIVRFPPGALRIEIGIQTLNPAVSARIKRPADPERELETIRFLKEKTNAIIHADLIAALPGEDLASFGRGFDRLWAALSPEPAGAVSPNGPPHSRSEIQLGILKLLPGAPIARHSESFGMCYRLSPPYEALETAALPARDLDRIKNFARFWELIVNRGLVDEKNLVPKMITLERSLTCAGGDGKASMFKSFMSLSDALLARFGRNWGIDKNELLKAVTDFWQQTCE
ncbi:MAG: radical SAM protein [Treponema sp.]|nr:radical SAM protein [Treponema sp.]